MRAVTVTVLTTVVLACRPSTDTTDPGLVRQHQAGADPLTVHDRLEALIEAGAATPQDRELAYRTVSGAPSVSAGDAYARAAVAGRLAELRGASAGGLVKEAEAWARKSIELDPDFREGIATRMLGTLYVLAPGRLLEHGDSEEGLELLEALCDKRPDDPRNHLRVAEAYIALGDPGPGFPNLCRALVQRAELRANERALLDRLIADVGGVERVACNDGGPGS